MNEENTNEQLYIQSPEQPPEQGPETEESTRTFKGGLILGLCLGLAFTIVVAGFLGYKLYRVSSVMRGVMDLNTINKIAVIEDVINKYYFDYNDRNLTPDDLRDGLYHGIVDSLNDKYADYYSEEELREELEENQGIYYGIGAYISLGDDGYPIFSGIIEDTPAEEAGLRPGDIIVEVDGVSAYGMSLDDVVSRVRGEEGTQVHLTIYRDGEDDYRGFDVTRAAVQSQTVNYEMYEDDIGYIRISQFDLVTIEQFTKAYNDLRSQDAKGLILDLRGNPGGLVTAVVEIARQILPEGMIFYEEDSAGNRTEHLCDGSHEIDIPLVVLINGYSASASEILSGSIRDHKVGTLVGTKSFGKGIVQDVKQLSDGSAVRLTVSAYFLPNGDNIQGVGIEPDVEVELDVDAYYDEGKDNQLDKALEIVKQQIAAR